MAEKVQIVEVGLRDGLQNESAVLNLSTRLEFAQLLAAAGLKRIEIGAFVHPQWVPQMSGTAKLVERVLKYQAEGRMPKDVQLSALVPNMRGMEDAIKSKIPEIAIFTAASESFCQHNINCTIDESIDRFKPVVDKAKAEGVKVRAYLSTCFACPYEGWISVDKVLEVVDKLLALEIYELSIGDTIGAATPKQVENLFKALLQHIPASKLAGHYHDTRGMAAANVLQSLELGIRTFDTSLGGLGGCPYAPGASGNAATEDIVYLLEGQGLETGIHLEKLIQINKWAAALVNHALPSRVAKAGIAIKA